MAYCFDTAPGEAPELNLGGEVQRRLQQQLTVPSLNRPLTGERVLSEIVINRLNELGVQYGDLRHGREQNRSISTTDQSVSGHRLFESEGIGIRVIYKGYWGFAATDILTEQGVIEAADQAVSMAKAVAESSPEHLGLKPNQWAQEPVHTAEFHTPVGLCPFDASVATIATPFLSAAKIALEKDCIMRAVGGFYAFGRRRLFASTEGSRILTTHCVTESFLRYHGVKAGNSAYRTKEIHGISGGLEHLFSSDLVESADTLAEEALLKCTAKAPTSGNKTLILDGHNLGLTMHESVGHPTELDRVLGYEFGFAGGSFADLEKLNNFQYGSSLVNFTANNTFLYGLASQGFDDEGVACQSFPVIRNGVLVGYGQNRETSHMVGSTRSNGSCRATNWWDAPIVRIPNLYLEPGKDKLSLDELIADTKEGIFMQGRDSFSIDQMRFNFQFGSNMAWRIENGKITEPLRDVIYQSISPEFWGSCDAICDASEWEMHGTINCGKGQPMQASMMTHGAAPSRFRNIRVGY